ncbi:MAG: hypothetical protein K6U74_11775, partial [Firmicutes bacterium]|nr:hypothetical protein [Bacillota bacterium]
AEEFAEHWHPAANGGWLVGIPESSQLISPGGHGWGDHDRAAQEIRGHYQTMICDHPVDPRRTVVAGFSLGGSVAVWMALGGILPVRGCLGIACAPRELDKVRAAVSDASARQLRLYLIVGEKDYLIHQARDFCEVLESAGMAVRFDVRPGLGHTIPDDFDRTLITALEFLLG